MKCPKKQLTETELATLKKQKKDINIQINQLSKKINLLTKFLKKDYDVAKETQLADLLIEERELYSKLGDILYQIPSGLGEPLPAGVMMGAMYSYMNPIHAKALGNNGKDKIRPYSETTELLGELFNKWNNESKHKNCIYKHIKSIYNFFKDLFNKWNNE